MMDITKEMLEIAKKHALDNDVANKIEFIEGNVESLPFEDNTFDIVVTRWTFHHFDKLQKVINEIYRVLKPKTGRLVFLEFVAPNITDDVPNNIVNAFNAMHTIRDPSHVWAGNEQGWIDEVNKGGFKKENTDIVDRFSVKMNWMDFIKWTNPNESDKRGRESIHVIAEFLKNCNCNVGMDFYDDDQGNLIFISNYIVIIASKD